MNKTASIKNNFLSNFVLASIIALTIIMVFFAYYLKSSPSELFKKGVVTSLNGFAQNNNQEITVSGIKEP